jgi:fibronectin-binding autotransporter adhesin
MKYPFAITLALLHVKLLSGSTTDYIWQGPIGSHNWFTATNWSPNGTPVMVGDTATFPDTASLEHSIAIDGFGANVKTININGSTAYTFYSDFNNVLFLTSATPPAQINVSGSGNHSFTNSLFVELDSNVQITVDQTFSILRTISEGSAGTTLTKAGSGTLALGGLNTYSGGSFLNDGQISLTLQSGTNTALGTGALTLQPGTTLELNSFQTFINPTSVPNSLIFAGPGAASIHAIASTNAAPSLGGILTLTGPATINVDSGATLTLANQITGASSLTKTGAGPLTLSSAANNYAGGTSLNQGTLTVPTNTSLGTGTLTMAGGTLDVGANLTITNDITFSSASTIQLLSGTSTFQTGTVTLNAVATMNVTGTELKLGGPITGTGSLTKIGSSFLTFQTVAKTYSGGTTISAGTLQSDLNQALPNTGTVNLDTAGATLSLNGNDQDIETLNGVSNTNVANINILNVTNGNFAGTISGLTFHKVGAGTLILSGPNTYTGGTDILNNGTLQAGAINTIPNGTVNLSDTATLNLNGFSQVIGSLNGVTANTISLGAANLSVTGGSFAGSISGSGSLTKRTAGVLTLNNTTPASTFSGGTTHQAGTIALQTATSLGTGTLNIGTAGLTLSAITFANPITLSGGSIIDTSLGTATLSGPISGSGSLTKTGADLLILSGATTYLGATNVNAGQITLLGTTNTGLGSGTVTLAGGTALNTTTTATITLSGPISGTGALNVTSGTTVLQGNNSYQGGTSLSAGATIFLQSNTGLGANTSALTMGNLSTLKLGNVTVANPITFSNIGIISVSGQATLSGTITGPTLRKIDTGILTLPNPNSPLQVDLQAGTISLGNSTSLGAAPLTMATNTTLELASGISPSNAITLSGTGLIQVATGTATLSGIISGPSGILEKIGNGTLELSGINSYATQTKIDAGVLRITTDQNLGQLIPPAPVSIGSATLEANGTFSISRLLHLTGSADIDVTTLNTLTLPQTIDGAGSLTKTGVGTLVLATANSYQGGTTVNAGTLSISNDNQLGLNVLTIGAGTLLTTSSITSTRNIVFNSGAIINTAGNTDLFTGAFSGAGSLSIEGGGTVKLLSTSAATHYTGVCTVVQPSSLYVNTNGVQGPIDLSGASAKLFFDQDFTGSYGSVLSGTGSITKIGTGTVKLPNNSAAFAGTTTISQGTLNVNGSLGGSMLTILPGATLSGAGTVCTTTSNGNLFPGNSVGTIKINGALTLQSGSNVQLTIEPSSASKVAVLGTAAIDGALTFEPQPGFYGFSACHTVLTSFGRTGTFSSVLSTVPGFLPTLTYTDLDVILCLEILHPFAGFSFSNSNTRAVGNNLDALVSAKELSPDLIATLNSFRGQSNATINKALDEMHPAQFSALTELQSEMDAALIALFHKKPYLKNCCDRPTRLWIEPFVNNLDLKKEDIQIGSNSTTGGVALGFDGDLNDQFSLGIGGAYNGGKLSWQESRGEADLNQFFGSLYADGTIGNFYLGATFLIGANFYETDRHIEFLTTNERAKAQFRGLDLCAQLASAYLFGSPQAFFYPYGNVDFFSLKTEQVDEQQAGGFDLTVKTRTDTTLRTELGLGLKVQDINAAGTICISPSVSVGWAGVFPIERPSFTSTFAGANIPFSVKGWNKTWNLLNIDFGLSVTYHCFSFGVEYDVEFSPDSGTTLFNQHGNISLDWKW